MDRETYKKIYKSLRTFGDVEKASAKYAEPPGVIAQILGQKTVKMVRYRYQEVHSEEERHYMKWKQGFSILDISKKIRFPPALTASFIMKNSGFSKKAANYLFKNPDSVQDCRLRRELIQALDKDYFFSPKAHALQVIKGEMGEAIIRKWLDDREISYLSEEDLRKSTTGKTPDFVLKNPFSIGGFEVSWIESKALFGDEFEHKHYTKKQFKEYSELFGKGMVVYWYGYLDGLASETYLIKDYGFFAEYKEEVEELLNYKVYW